MAYSVLIIDDIINMLHKVGGTTRPVWTLRKGAEQMRYLPHTQEEIASMLEAI